MDFEDEKIKRFQAFINGLKEDDMICIMHHTDPDGVSSGVIAAKAVERIRNKPADLRVNQASGDISVLPQTVQFLKEQRITKLITTDLCVDEDPETIKAVEEFAELLIIDHHKIYNDLTSNKTIFIKPQLVSDVPPVSYPTAKFAFDLFSSVIDLSDLDWVACIGTIGDCAYKQWKEFVDGVMEREGIEKNEDIFKTDLGRCASMISNSECYDASKVEECFNVLYSASSPEDVLSSNLQEYQKVIEEEISYWIDNVDTKAEIKGDLILYIIDPKYAVKSPISTLLSLKYPDKTIIILNNLGDGFIGLSARRNDSKVAVNDLLENAVKGLKDAGAGGHIPAAGGKIREEDLEEFKKRLFSLVGESLG